jgi:hypothetical protein
MFKFITGQDALLKQRREMEAVKAKQISGDEVNSIVFVTLAENGSIDEVTATEHTDCFAEWASGVAYTVGNIRQYNGQLYKCVQAHTSQEDWTPDSAASLWSKIGDPTVEYPEWAQPVGAHDAYSKGDKVSYNNKHWVSTVDANVWQPSVYGWDEVTD